MARNTLENRKDALAKTRAKLAYARKQNKAGEYDAVIAQLETTEKRQIKAVEAAQTEIDLFKDFKG